MRKTVLLTTVLALVIAGGLLYFFRPFGGSQQTRVVAKTITPDGTQLYVIQKPTGTLTEPFEISFFTKFNDNPWNWYYIDHQAIYWSSSRIDVDAKNKKAWVFKGKKKVAEFDLSTREFRLLNSNRPAPGPQEIKSPF